MSQATYVKEDTQSKVHFSEYLKTENNTGEDNKPAEETSQPTEPKEAE